MRTKNLLNEMRGTFSDRLNRAVKDRARAIGENYSVLSYNGNSAIFVSNKTGALYEFTEPLGEGTGKIIRFDFDSSELKQRTKAICKTIVECVAEKGNLEPHLRAFRKVLDERTDLARLPLKGIFPLSEQDRLVVFKTLMKNKLFKEYLYALGNTVKQGGNTLLIEGMPYLGLRARDKMISFFKSQIGLTYEQARIITHNLLNIGLGQKMFKEANGFTFSGLVQSLTSQLPPKKARLLSYVIMETVANQLIGEAAGVESPEVTNGDVVTVEKDGEAIANGKNLPLGKYIATKEGEVLTLKNAAPGSIDVYKGVILTTRSVTEARADGETEDTEKFPDIETEDEFEELVKYEDDVDALEAEMAEHSEEEREIDEIVVSLSLLRRLKDHEEAEGEETEVDALDKAIKELEKYEGMEKEELDKLLGTEEEELDKPLGTEEEEEEEEKVEADADEIESDEAVEEGGDGEVLEDEGIEEDVDGGKVSEIPIEISAKDKAKDEVKHVDGDEPETGLMTEEDPETDEDAMPVSEEFDDESSEAFHLKHEKSETPAEERMEHLSPDKIPLEGDSYIFAEDEISDMDTKQSLAPGRYSVVGVDGDAISVQDENGVTFLISNSDVLIDPISSPLSEIEVGQTMEMLETGIAKDFVTGEELPLGTYTVMSKDADSATLKIGEEEYTVALSELSAFAKPEMGEMGGEGDEYSYDKAPEAPDELEEVKRFLAEVEAKDDKKKKDDETDPKEVTDEGEDIPEPPMDEDATETSEEFNIPAPPYATEEGDIPEAPVSEPPFSSNEDRYKSAPGDIGLEVPPGEYEPLPEEAPNAAANLENGPQKIEVYCDCGSTKDKASEYIGNYEEDALKTEAPPPPMDLDEPVASIEDKPIELQEDVATATSLEQKTPAMSKAQEIGAALEKVKLKFEGMKKDVEDKKTTGSAYQSVIEYDLHIKMIDELLKKLETGDDSVIDSAQKLLSMYNEEDEEVADSKIAPDKEIPSV